MKVITAPMCTALTKNGRVVYFSQGDVLTDDISEESVKHLESLGFFAEADDAEQPKSRTRK